MFCTIVKESYSTVRSTMVDHVVLRHRLFIEFMIGIQNNGSIVDILVSPSNV